MSEMSEMTETVTPLHNVANRARIMKDALHETFVLDKNLKALAERHLKSDREAKSDIKKRLLKDLNITAKVFNARYVAYRLEATALEASDEATLDNLRELFEHAPVGSTADMIQAIGDDKQMP